MADLKDINDRQDPRVGVGQWLREEAGVGGSEAGFGRWGQSIWQNNNMYLLCPYIGSGFSFIAASVYNLHEV